MDDTPSAVTPATQWTVRDPQASNYQTEIVHSLAGTAGNADSPVGGGAPALLAQNPASPEIIRPGIPAVQGAQPTGAGPAGVTVGGVQSPTGPAQSLQNLASPFDATQFRLPTLGLPPGLGTPEPTPEVKREYGQFVEREIAPENTIEVVAGRAKVMVLRRETAPHLRPRRKRGGDADRHRQRSSYRRQESGQDRP